MNKDKKFALFVKMDRFIDEVASKGFASYALADYSEYDDGYDHGFRAGLAFYLRLVEKFEEEHVENYLDGFRRPM